MTTARRWPPNARLLPVLRLHRFRPALFAAIRAPHPTAREGVASPMSLPARHSPALSPTEGPLVTSRLNSQVFQSLVVVRAVRLILERIHHSRVVHHFQVIQRAQHIHIALHLRRFPQNSRNQNPALPIQLHYLAEITRPHQELALRLIRARRLRQLVFNLAPYVHGVDSGGLTGNAGDVKLAAKFLQSLEKHGGYLQTTLLVHLRWTVSPQFHVSPFVGESVCPIPPQPSRPPYFTLPRSTFNHSWPHPIPNRKHVKGIPPYLCITCGF